MAIPYKQWLTLTGRKGTAADAYRWKTTHGVALGKYNPDGSPYKPPDTATPAAEAPNHAAIQAGEQQLAGIHSVYNPQYISNRDQAKASLAGYGDVFTWQADNPATPQDESMMPTVAANPESRYGTGQVYRNANRSEANSYAAHGTLYSSYHDQALAQAYLNLNDQAKKILTQYATNQSNLRNQEQTAMQTAATNLVSLYGPDASYIANWGTDTSTSFTPNVAGLAS